VLTPAGRYTSAQLWRLRRPLRRLAGWSLVEALPALVGGYATARAVDDGFLAGRLAVGLAWLGGFAAAAGLGAVGSRRGYRCLADIVEPFRDRLVTRLVSGAIYRSTEAGAGPDGAAVARLTHQVEIVRDTLAGLLTVLRGFLFSGAAALVGLLALAPALALVVLAPLVIGLALFASIIPAMKARQRTYMRAGEELAAAAGTVLHGHRDVVASGATDWATATVGARIDEQAHAERSLARIGAVRSVSLAVGGWLPLVLVLASGPWLVRHGVPAGAVLGAVMYVLQALQPALHSLVHGVAGGGLRFTITLGRILDASEVPSGGVASVDRPAPARPDHQRTGGTTPASALLSMRAVSFRYGPDAAPVLDQFDLDIPDGDHLVVIGASGVGKSTLAALMAGLLRPQSGEVRLGGVSLVDRPGPESIRSRVLIPQEAYVFAGTVWENLTYHARGATRTEMDGAVERLGMTGLICRLGGYDARLDTGALSAGERQLIALARAYLAPARLAILDEATCHLDPAAEAQVEREFAARPGAVIVIAHRISSARRARRVLVLDGARPELGTHDDLLVTSAGYREQIGYWDGSAGRAGPDCSDPARLARQVDGLDPGTGAGLGDNAGQVVSHRTG
jgi:ATP-binding cassette subfamily C protein